MEREKILKIAEEWIPPDSDIRHTAALLNFANAIAAHEREEIGKLIYAYKDKLNQDNLTEYIKCHAVSDVEDAIRARGNKKEL